MKKQKAQFLNNKSKTKMKKIILSLALVVFTTVAFSQSVFNKYEGKEGVTSVIVNKKMFSLMGKVDVDAKGKEKQFMDLVKKLDNLKVFMTDNVKTGADMKATVTGYLKSNPLDELMRVNDEGKKVNIYVKSGASENVVKELLMFIETPGSQENQAVVLSLTGNFNLDEISALTDKMNLPGGEELKKASKK